MWISDRFPVQVLCPRHTETSFGIPIMKHMLSLSLAFLFFISPATADEIDLDNPEMGQSFTAKGRTYHVLTEYYSTLDETTQEDTTEDSKHLDTTFKIVPHKINRSKTYDKQKSRISFIRSDKKSSDRQTGASVKIVDSQTRYPVVLDAKNGKIGILMGTISVKVKDMADVDAIAEDMNLSVVRQFPHLNLVVFTGSNDQDIIDMSDSLSQDPRIKRTSIEILEEFRVVH